MSNQLIRQGIRLRADERSREPMLDAYTNATPQGWTRAATQFEVALARGGGLADVANLASVTLEAAAYADKDGPRVFSRTLAGADLQAALTEATWADGTAQHALFVFSNAEMNVDLQGADSADFWLVVTALTQAGDGIVCGTGRLTMCADGAFLAVPPPPANPGAGITVDQADTRYVRLGAQDDGAFLPDVDEATGSPTSLVAVPVTGLRPGEVRRMEFVYNVEGIFGTGVSSVLATYQLATGFDAGLPDTVPTPQPGKVWRLVSYVADNGVTGLPGGLSIQPDGVLGLGGAQGGTLRTNGHGSPEGAVAAPVGSLYLDQDGGAGAGVLHVKEGGGDGFTGWRATRATEGGALNPASIGVTTPGTGAFTGVTVQAPGTGALVVHGGAPGTMAFPYEAAAFEREGDTKFGIYTSQAAAGGAVSLTFGSSRYAMASGRLPGFEVQHLLGASPAGNTLRVNFLERHATGGTVQAARADIVAFHGEGGMTLGTRDAAPPAPGSGGVTLWVSSSDGKLHATDANGDDRALW